VRFSAVDGSVEWDRLVRGVDVSEFRRNVGREVLPGEIGCYHSHLTVWRALVDSPYEVALVLEDDVLFHEDFMLALETAITVRNSWDIVKLNCIRAKQPVTRLKVGGYSLNAYLGPFTGMGAYLISREFAARQLAEHSPIVQPIDHAIDRFDSRKFRHYGLEPFPSHVDDYNRSTITGNDFADIRRFPWYRRLPVYRKRLKNLLMKAQSLLKAIILDRFA
jgi:glycosyl transferase, family 25